MNTYSLYKKIKKVAIKEGQIDTNLHMIEKDHRREGYEARGKGYFSNRG